MLLMRAVRAAGRAFVHVDYQVRDEPEHKVERELERNRSGGGHAQDSPNTA